MNNTYYLISMVLMSLMMVGLSYANIIKGKDGYPRKAFEVWYYDFFAVIYAVIAACLLFMERYKAIAVYLANGQSMYETGFSPYVGSATFILAISVAYFVMMRYLARWVMVLKAIYLIETEKEARRYRPSKNSNIFTLKVMKH